MNKPIVDILNRRVDPFVKNEILDNKENKRDPSTPELSSNNLDVLVLVEEFFSIFFKSQTKSSRSIKTYPKKKLTRYVVLLSFELENLVRSPEEFVDIRLDSTMKNRIFLICSSSMQC